MLNWLQQFNTFCFLDNHQYQVQPHSHECLAAAGTRQYMEVKNGAGLLQLQEFVDLNKGKWLFGHLNYDVKNELELLSSTLPDSIMFPNIFFFEPAVMIRLTEEEMEIDSEDPHATFEGINAFDETESGIGKPGNVTIQHRLEKKEYIDTILQLKQHIRRGDCYEINFCQEFFAEHAVIEPWQVYEKLSAVSPNPFSAIYRLQDKWLLCASPERFLRKKGKSIIAQPIKGTSQRETGNAELDERSRSELFNSEKDRAENVMIVDLMRNDLSKICDEGSVKVDELYGIYSFPQVHQMISTISGELKGDPGFTEIIRACFPMGSMTGAPKKKVMELIEMYEKTRRGIFSGTLGYISPGGDFDLNVIIRSIMYNSGSRYLSFQTGSAITFYSDPEKEWDECLLKAEAMKQCF